MGLILKITETKRVEKMESDWYKITGVDQHGRSFEVDESQLPYRLNTGEFAKCRELGDGKVMALTYADGYEK